VSGGHAVAVVARLADADLLGVRAGVGDGRVAERAGAGGFIVGGAEAHTQIINSSRVLSIPGAA